MADIRDYLTPTELAEFKYRAILRSIGRVPQTQEEWDALPDPLEEMRKRMRVLGMEVPELRRRTQAP